MFLTKKHLSRRAVLKGAGVALALPLLDAMIPAATALAQTADPQERERLWEGQTGKRKTAFYSRKREVESREFDV